MEPLVGKQIVKVLAPGGADDVGLRGGKRTVEGGSLMPSVGLVGYAGPLDLDALLNRQDADELEKRIGIIGIQAGDELSHPCHASHKQFASQFDLPHT